ncbi:hypothetical protein R6Q59_018125 [Mikania micrantha]
MAAQSASVTTAPPPPMGFAQNASVTPALSAMAAANKLVNKVLSFPNRCLTCKKTAGVMGFKCKCGDTFW